MSSTAEKKLSLHQMQKARDGEWNRLRGTLSALAESLEQDPAGWIASHPYAATASAALAGFVVAQIPLPRLAHKKPKRPSKKEEEEEDEHPSQLMTLLTGLAQQYLTQPPPCSSESQEDGTVMVADGGAVAGTTFPANFSTAKTS